MTTSDNWRCKPMTTTFSSPYHVTLGPPSGSYRGAYINLDRHPERRLEIDNQLNALGIADRYIRLSAVDGTSIKSLPDGKSLPVGMSPAAAGCFWSHYLALEKFRSANTCVHILEDDAILTSYLPQIIDNGQRERQFDKFDIVFTETFVGYNAWFLRRYKKIHNALLAKRQSVNADPSFAVIDITSDYMATTSSYFVAPHAIERVLATFKRGLDMGPRLPFDLFLCQEASQGRLKIGCIFPFVTIIRLDRILQSTISTIDTDAEGHSKLAAALLRYSFFVNCDFDGYAKTWLDAIRAKRASRKPDRQLEVMTEMLEFVMSDDFRMF